MKIDTVEVTKNGKSISKVTENSKPATNVLLDYEKIGKTIHDARLKKGYKNGQSFYRALYPGIKKTDNAAAKFISCIESGKSLNLETLVLISRCLSMSLDSLIYGESDKNKCYSVSNVCKLLLELTNIFDIEVSSTNDMLQTVDAKEINLKITPKLVSRLATNNWRPTLGTNIRPQKIINFVDMRAVNIENFFLDISKIQTLSDNELGSNLIESLKNKQGNMPLIPPYLDNIRTSNAMLNAGDTDIFQYNGGEFFTFEEEELSDNSGLEPKHSDNDSSH